MVGRCRSPFGQTRCLVEHVGLVLAGAATAALDDGRVIELRAGELFHIPAIPHDSWVLGDAPYISLHFFGSEQYSKQDASRRCSQPQPVLI